MSQDVGVNHTGQPAYPTLPPLVAGRDYPQSYRELVEMFPDDLACARYLESLRWPTGFTCRASGVSRLRS
nr:transposase [Thiorhodococcus minor]